MFNKMFMFEWRYFTRQPSFYVSALIFFSIALFTTGFQKFLGSFGSNIHINGPFFIGQIMSSLAMFAMFLVVNFVANCALRDDTSDMAEIIYCKPIKPLGYQLGRFFGAFAVTLVVFSMVPLALFIGSLMPWVAEERLGPVELSHYLTTFIYLSVPTLFFFSCLYYAIAIRMRTMMAVYLSVIAVFVLSGVAGTMFLSHRDLAALIDPFAGSTFLEISRYWTVAEKNGHPITLSGVLLENRLIWIALGVIIMVAFGKVASPLTLFVKKSAKKQSDKNSFIQPTVPEGHHNIHLKGSVHAGWTQFLTLTRFEIKQVLLSPAFIILCSFMFLLMTAVLFQPKGMFGSTNLPFTQIMVQVIKGSMVILSTIVITYYSAEVVWRERQSGVGDIIDSSPVNNLSFWLSKLAAVWAVIIGLLVFAMGVTITYQLANGFTQLDLQQYFIGLFYFLALPWMMMSVLAFFLQVISPNKYLGMFLFALFVGSNMAMESLGLSHNMFRFSKSPVLVYTDMNGYGWSLISHSWYMLYWGALSVALSVLGYGLWQRGPVQPLKHRVKHLGYQIGSKGKLSLGVCALVFVASGSSIYYNTRVLNDFAPKQEMNRLSAEFEKQYSPFVNDPVPMIKKINVEVDIFPELRKVEARGKILLVNDSSSAIERFLVVLPSPNIEDFSLNIEGGKLTPDNDELDTYWFEFDQVMEPGERRSGAFELVREHNGFMDDNSNANEVEIVKNGSFFAAHSLFPMFGYNPLTELVDPGVRKKHGLAPPKRAHKLEDSRHYDRTIKGRDIGYIEFEATVSTSADQIAIAPGSLQNQWQDNNRRYFHYKSDAPMQYFVAFMSAKFEVLRSKHNGVDVEIYYHPDHQVNVQRMQQGVVDSLDYFSNSFGPYPHKQVRIIEFPGYRNFAQSFPNTIAFSERIGFITDLRDENEIDQIYYVIAHEMAHQWWGGQVDGANVQGSTMISETLSQYSALMLFKQKFGDKKRRRILKIELDRYLRERTSELVEEMPLMRVENQQYIHYRKGSVAMMSLVDLIGEARMNKALARFLKAFRYSGDPYPTTLDLMAFINEGASKQELRFIESLFAQINLYDLKTTDVAIAEVENNEFEVTLTIDASRLNDDGQGNEHQVELSEMIDIGLFEDNPDDISATVGSASDSQLLYLKKHLIVDGINKIKVRVPTKPAFAGIDPFVKLIDRDTEDNIIEL